MASASDSVVVFTATDQTRVATLGDIPFTVTTVVTEEILAGQAVGPRFEVRQIGAEHVTVTDGLPLLRPGDRYVGFLLAETFTSETPQPQYWPVESSGLFKVEGVSARHLDPESRLGSVVLELKELERRAKNALSN